MTAVEAGARRSPGDRPDEAVVMVWGRATGMGGTETRMCEVAGELSRRGIRCVAHMLSADGESELSKCLRRAGAEVIAGSSARALGRSIRETDPSIVISMGLRASLMARSVRALSLRSARRWALIDARNGLEAGRSRWLWTIDRRTQALVTWYLTNSHAVESMLRDQRIASKRTKVLYSALPPVWNAPQGALRRPGSVVMVGNDRPEKQHELGVRAFVDAQVPVELTVYTDRGGRVRTAWEESEPSARATFRCVEGARMTPELLDNYAVLLHPSSHESASRAIIEARARGCLVVGFDVGDARRLVGSDGGRLVPVGDVVGLTSALRDAVDASLRGTLSHAPVAVRDLDAYVTSLLELAMPARTETNR